MGGEPVGDERQPPGGDEEKRAAVAAVPREKLDLVGIAVHAPRNAADKIVKGARMHP